MSDFQEIMFQRLTSQITAVKKDMVILEKSEFSALLAENEVGVLPSSARPRLHLRPLRFSTGWSVCRSSRSSS